MTLKSTVHYLPAVLLLLLGAILASGNWYFQPDQARRWATALTLIAFMFGLVLFASRRHEESWASTAVAFRDAIAFAATILVIALGSKLGAAVGLLESADLSRRATMVVLGVFFMFMGNGMPKTLTPLAALRCDAGRVQAFQRFAGWTWVVTGFAFSIVWALFPLDLAKPVSVALLFGGGAMVAAQIVRLVTMRRRQA